MIIIHIDHGEYSQFTNKDIDHLVKEIIQDNGEFYGVHTGNVIVSHTLESFELGWVSVPRKKAKKRRRKHAG